MDGQFEHLQEHLKDLRINLNITSRNEHVPEVERYIQTLKERTRSIYNTLPFKEMPAQMVIKMVYACNFWLNLFPHENGISLTLSPRAIIVGKARDYTKNCQLEFRTYVQTHKEHNNLMTTRTIGAIAL
jgi:hypothetical protein